MIIDKCIPKIYKKNIFDINYLRLKKEGIKCIIFDLDNTLTVAGSEVISEDVKSLLEKLNKDFKVIIMSNNFKKYIIKKLNNLDLDIISFAIKPSSKGFKKIVRKYNFSREEMCIIGDQLLTDMLGGNNFKITTILVDPITKNDLKITKINRIIELKIFKYFKNKGILERGKYYES